MNPVQKLQIQDVTRIKFFRLQKMVLLGDDFEAIAY